MVEVLKPKDLSVKGEGARETPSGRENMPGRLARPSDVCFIAFGKNPETFRLAGARCLKTCRIDISTGRRIGSGFC